MKKLLADHFTVYVDKMNGKISGGALKTLENGQGMHPVELNESQLEFIHLWFPEIEKTLEAGNMLQVYHNGYTYILDIGQTSKGQPYGEGDYFDIISESSDPTFTEAFYKMNEELSNQDKTKEPQTLKRVQRLYGQTTYK